MNWAAGVIAPWCLGMALLVSITADAGQNATIGGSFAARSRAAVGEPRDLVPAALIGDSHAFGMARDPLASRITLDLDLPVDPAPSVDEVEPRATRKRGGTPLPTIDRTHKGDPAIGLRPSFDSQLRQPGGLMQAELLGPHDEAMPAASFSTEDEAGPLDGATSFTPYAAGEDMEDSADAPVNATATATPMRPAALNERLAQGATPRVSRADALSSTTPASVNDAPIAAVLSPRQLALPNATIVPRFGGRPNYAALLMGEQGQRERKCLAEAVYFESRSEPEEGQAAVAQVVLNRVVSGLYPQTICGVVYQNRTHRRACQFSFACDGRPLRVTEPTAWDTAMRVSDAVLEGRTYLSDVGGATHYHANYVRPSWSRRLVKMDVIGHHIFYKLRRGQT